MQQDVDWCDLAIHRTACTLVERWAAVMGPGARLCTDVPDRPGPISGEGRSVSGSTMPHQGPQLAENVEQLLLRRREQVADRRDRLLPDLA